MLYHRNRDACEKLAAKLSCYGGKIKSFGADITDAKQRARLIEQILDSFGGIDILINNAGSALYGLLQQNSEAEIEQVLNTDLTAQILLTRCALPSMIAAHAGSIVNVSSVWGLTGASCEAAYSAAKAGLIGFTKALAKELAPSGIRVNAVAPGVVDTQMMAYFTPEEKEAIREEIPLGRFARAEEIARSILFMAGQEYITGQVLSPNGGSVI